MADRDAYPDRVLSWLSSLVLLAAAALAMTAALYAFRSRVVDDRLLLVVAVLELLLFVQLVVGLVRGVTRHTDFERPVFFAYLVTVPFVAPVATFIALKEKTRGSMAVVLGSALVVGVLVARLLQLWGSNG